jgi:hypothetical protein
VPDSRSIYRTSKLVVCVDSDFGSLVQLKEVFREISFPTNSVFFKDSVSRSIQFIKHSRAFGTYRLVLAGAEMIFKDAGKETFPTMMRNALKNPTNDIEANEDDRNNDSRTP